MRRLGILCSLAASAVVLAGGTRDLSSHQTTQAPVFRRAVTLVPIDVRVLDARTGLPVTDLAREDFQVLENGVAQDIRHFALQALAPESPARGEEHIAMRGAAPGSAPGVAGRPMRGAAATLSPAQNRLFLIVLGTGRLQLPSRGLDALLQFVRTRLLPQDLVAILAYDRATDFTADHERVARIIERFKQENAALDMELSQATGGMAAVYGRRSLPKAVQARIDRVFDADGALASRVVGTAENARSAARTSDDVDRQMNAAEIVGPGFDRFVSSLWTMRRDLGSIYAGLAYLRELDGEKHLLFLTEGGFLLPRVEDDQDLVQAASDARVTINIFQTGGVTSGFSALLSASMRRIAQDTGGTASIAEYSQPAMERLDAATRVSYLLGYYPADTKPDLRFRRIEVRVNRRNVIVRFRRGYFAREEIPSFSRRGFIVHQRLLSAAMVRKAIPDIGVTVTATRVAAGGGPQIRIDARIDPAHLYFATEKGRRVGRIDIGQFAYNSAGKISSEGWQTVDLQFTEETYQRVAKAGIPYRVRMPVKGEVTDVVLAVYDYMADLVGAAPARVK